MPNWENLVVLDPIMSTDFAGQGLVWSSDGGETITTIGTKLTLPATTFVIRTISTRTREVVDEWTFTNQAGGAAINSFQTRMYAITGQNTLLPPLTTPPGGNNRYPGSINEINLLSHTAGSYLTIGYGAGRAAISPDNSLIATVTLEPLGIDEPIFGPHDPRVCKIATGNPPTLLAQTPTGTTKIPPGIPDFTAVSGMEFTPNGNTLVLVAQQDIWTMDVASWAVTNRLTSADAGWPIGSDARQTGGLKISEDGQTAWVVMQYPSADTNANGYLIDFDISTLTTGSVQYLVNDDPVGYKYNNSTAATTAAGFILILSSDESHMFIIWTDTNQNVTGQGSLKVIRLSDGAEIVEVLWGVGCELPGGSVPSAFLVESNEEDFWFMTPYPIDIFAPNFANERWFHIGPMKFTSFDFQFAGIFEEVP